MAQEGRKGPMSTESQGLEMEADDDWWSVEDSHADLKEKELRDMWHADHTEVAVAPVAPVPVTYARQCSKGQGAKRVSFSSINVRLYSVILGDHPCCIMGCPLALGWEFAEEMPLLIDDYEATRPQRRTRDALRTTRDKRREMLVDYTDGDVRRVQRRLQRERSSCRSKALASFFTPTASPPLIRTPSCE